MTVGNVVFGRPRSLLPLGIKYALVALFAKTLDKRNVLTLVALLRDFGCKKKASFFTLNANENTVIH